MVVICKKCGSTNDCPRKKDKNRFTNSGSCDLCGASIELCKVCSRCKPSKKAYVSSIKVELTPK